MSKKRIFPKMVDEDICGGSETSAAAQPVPDNYGENYYLYKNRLKTYSNWAKYFFTKKEALSHAGFI